jgi:hypothetical protein
MRERYEASLTKCADEACRQRALAAYQVEMQAEADRQRAIAKIVAASTSRPPVQAAPIEPAQKTGPMICKPNPYMPGTARCEQSY